VITVLMSLPNPEIFGPALDVVYLDKFHWGEKSYSLVYLAAIVGASFSFFIRCADIQICRQIEKQGRRIEPKHKMLGFYIAAFCLPVGLFWFSATVPSWNRTISPWASIVSQLFIGYAIMEFDYVLSSYGEL
jgi:hypothetical protein